MFCVARQCLQPALSVRHCELPDCVCIAGAIPATPAEPLMPAVLPTASHETLDGISDRQKLLVVNLIFTVLIQPNLFCIDIQSGCGF